MLPDADPTLGGELALLELERAAFEAELGTRVDFSPVDPGAGARWLLEIDEEHDGPATVEVLSAQTIVSRARTRAGSSTR